jgi:hypothetical protein
MKTLIVVESQLAEVRNDDTTSAVEVTAAT